MDEQVKQHLGVLVKRLRPATDEMNVYLDDAGKLKGYLKDAQGKSLSLPTLSQVEAEWAHYEAPPEALSELDSLRQSLAQLQAQVQETQEALLDLLLAGGG